MEDSYTEFNLATQITAGRMSHTICGRNNTASDVNLECDEVIDDWDDIDNSFTSLYSPCRHEKYPVTQQQVLDSHELYYTYPPPNSPANVSSDDSSHTNKYADGLLKLWNELNNSSGSVENQPDSPQSINDSQSTFVQARSTIELNGCVESVEANNTEGHKVDECNDTTTESSVNSSFASDVLLEDSNIQLMPISQSSSRSPSPAEVEALSESVLGMSFDNLRSVSPRIRRSPSPISFHTSSPRYVRSPSPFQVLNSSNSSGYMDDSTDGLVFYDDRYVFRSVSPSILTVDNHIVPDVDMELQDAVSLYAEFPSFTTYRRRRSLNSCQDQVVPEYIEE